MPHGCMGVIGPTVSILANDERFQAERSIIDLGCGYGLMASVVKALWPDRLLTGIEAQERYHNPMWDLYQEVRIADIRTEIPAMIARQERFEVGFLFEILEHLPHEDGEALHWLLHQLAPRWFMSTPNVYFGARWSEWDMHQCVWSQEELDALGWQLLDPRGMIEREGQMVPLTWEDCGWPMWFGVLGEWDLRRQDCYEVRS